MGFGAHGTRLDDNVQEFGSSIHVKVFHRMTSWKVKSRLNWNCMRWRFIQRYRCPSKKSKTMVKRSVDQEFRLRNFDARHGKIDTGPVVKNQKGLIGVEGGEGIWYQWKEKGQCSEGDQCSFRHESNERAQKPDHNAATLSEPSVSRGRSVLEEKYPRQN